MAQRLLTATSVKSFKDIPGPFKLPFIGSLLHYKLGILDSTKYHKVLNCLYQEYGPLVKEQLGNKTILHVFDLDDIKGLFFCCIVPPYDKPKIIFKV